MVEVDAIGNPIAHPSTLVHIVSHGPHCLDGVTAAVAVARYHADATLTVRFANNPEIDDVLATIPPPPSGARQDLWITDIGWTRSETDRHLRALVEAGTRIFWVDHHRTAIERVRRGAIEVPLAEQVVEDTYAASRLVFEHLRARPPETGSARPEFRALERLVLLADDNDRWIHAHPASRDLALTVAAMHETEAYQDLLSIDAAVTYTARMRAAAVRVQAEVAATHALADRTRRERSVGRVTVAAAWCEGYPSEIGDVWGRATPNLVVALYDGKSGGVSFRRSPACTIDLSRVAETFGGGGHAAAAGCQIPGIGARDADALATMVAAAVERIGS